MDDKAHLCLKNFPVLRTTEINIPPSDKGKKLETENFVMFGAFLYSKNLIKTSQPENASLADLLL